jgi:hypothetical protein
MTQNLEKSYAPDHNFLVIENVNLQIFRMNLRDATKIINKADTGITLNKSEQKLAELMLHSHSNHQINTQKSAGQFFRDNNDSVDVLLDFNSIHDVNNELAEKDIEDTDLHHVLKVI